MRAPMPSISFGQTGVNVKEAYRQFHALPAAIAKVGQEARPTLEGQHHSQSRPAVH